MSGEFISAMEIIEQKMEAATIKPLREEVFDMDLAVKNHMDQGLSPEEMAVARKVREATQAAEIILESISSLAANAYKRGSYVHSSHART